MNEREFIRIGRAVLERAEEAERELTAANERIRELEKLSEAISRDCNNTANERNSLRDQLTAEREVSDKLEKALKKIDNDTEDNVYPYRALGASGPVKAVARAALSEVAAIRSKGEKQ